MPNYISNNGLSYYTKTVNLTTSFIDIGVFAISNKWNNFDIQLLYKRSNDTEWKDNAVITFCNGEKILNNKVLGLQAGTTEIKNVVRWEYTRNGINYGEQIKTRIELLPRIRNFNTSILHNSIVDCFGKYE